jgi:nucleoside-diphosphate-sugar epimerase
VFVTGGAGFIGGATVRQLRERGDDVTAAVRDPSRATVLRDLGVDLVANDLGSVATLRVGMDTSDSVIHLAGSYRVGIRAGEHPAMYEANVAVTERVLDAAIAVGIPRIVAVSTANVLGNTHGRLVDETYQRDPADGYLSYYDETKVLSHRIAEARIANGAPVIIAMPGTTYGPGDHSAIGAQLRQAFEGTARAIAFGDLGISAVHVDDLAAGIIAALDGGRLGESYLLSGECLRLAEAMRIAARAGGRRPPQFRVPTGLLRAAVPVARAASRLGIGRFDLAEAIRAADGVTYWSSHAKATTELGYSVRPLRQGVIDAFGHA